MEPLLDERKPLTLAVVREAKYAVERGDELTQIQSVLLSEHLRRQKVRLDKLRLQDRDLLSRVQQVEHDELARELDAFKEHL